MPSFFYLLHYHLVNDSVINLRYSMHLVCPISLQMHKPTCDNLQANRLHHSLIKVKLKVIMAKRLVIHVIERRLHHQSCIPNKVLCQFLICIVRDQEILTTQKGMCRTIHLNTPCRYSINFFNTYYISKFMCVIFCMFNRSVFN